MSTVIALDEHRKVWGHAFCICVLCLREWTAACFSTGPYECPTCHQMSGQRWEGPPSTLAEVLQRFPMENA